MKPRSPAAYKEDTLTVGGALVFTAAVLIQLLSMKPLPPSLTVALFACSVAIPTCATVLALFVIHEEFPRRFNSACLNVLGFTALVATFVCASSIFWYFSWIAGAVFLAFSVLAICLMEGDRAAQRRANVAAQGAPNNSLERSRER